MSVTEGYNALYLKQHGIRHDFHEGMKFFPDALETSACTANVNSLGRNVMEAAATASKAALPWMAPVAAISLVGQAALAGPVALSMVRDSLIKGKAALACGDTEGVAVNAAHGTMGSAYLGVAGLLAYLGISALQGATVSSGAALALPGVGIGLYGLLVLSSIYNLKQSSDFGKTLAAKKLEGIPATLKWFEEQLSLTPEEMKTVTSSEGKLNEEQAAKLLQKKWNGFELRTNPKVAAMVRHQLPGLLSNPDHPLTAQRAVKLLESVREANYKTQVRHKALILIAIVGLASMIAAIVLSAGLAVPILAAVGALLWMTVDSSKLHNYIGEKCWTWHRGEKPLETPCRLLSA
jgi:hypothetical protein